MEYTRRFDTWVRRICAYDCVVRYLQLISLTLERLGRALPPECADNPDAYLLTTKPSKIFMKCSNGAIMRLRTLLKAEASS